MKIAEVRVQPYALPMRAPFQTAREVLQARQGALVWLRDEDGRWGVGEAAPLAGFGLESLQACSHALRRCTPHLQGTLQEERPALGGTGSSWPVLHHLSGFPAARHAVECALADLAAQRLGQPLWRWLLAMAELPVPAQPPAQVRVNAMVGAEQPRHAAERARALAGAGFRTVKIKLGVESPQADAQRMTAVRQALGAHLALRGDVNAAWSEEQALPALEALAPLHLEYVEQPLPAEDRAAMARLARVSPIPIAADESALSVQEAQQVLQERAAQVLIIKPMALGGLLPALAVARMAHQHGVPAVVTSMIEGAVGRTAALHVAAAMHALGGGRPLPACGLATGSLLAQDVVPAPPVPHEGQLQVPQSPGLGLAGLLMPQPSAAGALPVNAALEPQPDPSVNP